MKRELVLDKGLVNYTPAELRSYINDIASIPLATEEDEFEKNDNLITGNLRFVLSVAKHYMGNKVPLGDLIQYGSIGLIKARDNYDPTKGFKFISYAVWWIRQAIANGIWEETLVRVPLNRMRESQAMKKEFEDFMQEYNIETIPNLDIYEAEVKRIDDFVSRTGKGVDSYTRISDTMSEEEPARYPELKELLQYLIPKTNFGKDSERIQAILFQYITALIDGQSDISIRSDLAIKHNRTPERIRQIIKKNLPKLKDCPLLKDFILTK